jgi:tetratricopeptide (TPR) repeat protein
LAEANRLTGRGAAYRELGQNEDALSEMDKAITLLEDVVRDPDNRSAPINLTIALLNRALLVYDMGKADEYLAACERAYRTVEAEKARGGGQSRMFENEYAKVLYYLAWAYVEQKKPQAQDFMERTYTTLTRMAREQKDNAPVRRYLCDLIENLRVPGYDQLDVAAQYARELVALNPKAMSSYEALARAQELMGQKQEAAATYRQALAALGEGKNGEAGSRVRTNLEKRIEALEASGETTPASEKGR